MTCFMEYQKFWSYAVTPRPDWEAESDLNAVVSTTTPPSETDCSAMKFSLWKNAGKEILINSNIDNWLVSSPSAGSLVEWQHGSDTCNIVKRMTSTCSDQPPPAAFKGARVLSLIKTYLLLTEFEGRTVNYGPCFSPLIYGTSTRP